MKNAKSVFLGALDCVSAEELNAYLDAACGGDVALRARVEELLRAKREAGSFLGGEWAFEPDESAPFAEAPGAFVGQYKLLEQIGEGGFGVVFLAEQQQPVRRRVALKVIKPGMDTRDVIGRFEAERQALAIMDHPNIARVLDAGATHSGRPFFVMELVRGVAITDYCDQHGLTPYERLELFLSVCNAVQHAHQKGVIHRDIKPSNVLVTSHDGRPVVKVIDFGVAKAISGQLADRSVYTRFTQMIGTPLYMSPEQAEMSGLDIDTRTDIYSLGVLLYELLTGTTPFDRRRLSQAALDEIRRIIREEEPPKPSARLSESGDSLPSIAANRHMEPARLTKLIRGDLDWIVMKALEKDRRRRYETANGLASDIQRYLLDEPVSAAAPSRVYRIRKFVMRNRLTVIASAAVVVTLVAGLVGTTIGLIGQSRQRAAAVDAQEQLQAVNDFLMYDVFAGVETDRLPDNAVREQIVKVMIDPAAATVEQRFQGKPLVEAKVRQALGNAYESVGRGDLALPHERKALEIHRRLLGADHRDTLISTEVLGNLLRSLGMEAEAEPLLIESLSGFRQRFGDADEDSIFALNGLATLRQSQGRLDQAELLYREALANSRRVLGNEHETTVTLINNLGYVLLRLGRLDEADPLLTESYELCPRVLGESHRGTLRSIDNMGVLRSEQGRLNEAEKLYREAMERSRRVLGDDDPHTLHTVNDMGGILMEQGRFEEAEPLVREALERRRRVLGADHPDTIVSLTNLGLFLRRKGDLSEAEPLTREALAHSRRIKGDDHPDTLVAISNLGTLLMAQNKWDEAEPFVREAQERSQHTLSDAHPMQATALYNLGALLYYQGKLDEAAPLYLEALDRRRRQLGEGHVDTLNVLGNLGLLRQDQGQLDQAEALFRDALAGYQRALSDSNHPQIGAARLDLGVVLTKLARYPQAEAELLEAERILRMAQGVQTRRLNRCREALATLYQAWEQAEPGHGHGDKAQPWREKRESAKAAPSVPPTDRQAAH